MNGWMYLIFRTKVPEISGGHNGRQDQLFRVDARAHRPPLHRAHSIYQSKFNHLEQMTLVTFKLVRLTLRLSVFFLKCSCISKCPTWRFLVAVWTNIRCRFILPQNHGSSPVGSPPQILCWILYFKHTLCFLFFFLPIFSPRTCIQRLLDMEFNRKCSSIYRTDIPVAHVCLWDSGEYWADGQKTTLIDLHWIWIFLSIFYNLVTGMITNIKQSVLCMKHLHVNNAS